MQCSIVRKNSQQHANGVPQFIATPHLRAVPDSLTPQSLLLVLKLPPIVLVMQ